jgi:hypothetical protein
MNRLERSHLATSVRPPLLMGTTFGFFGMSDTVGRCRQQKSIVSQHFARLRRSRAISHIRGMPKRRPKTPAELKEDMQNFDRACTREFNKAMVRLAERLLTPPKGQRRPPLYKMKLPRITRTIVE